MSRLCEGRVAIVTGAGRGFGREHALLLAAHGAKVMVNDIGAGIDGSGRDASLAGEVVSLDQKGGGEAIVNGDDVSDWNGAKAMIDAAIKHLRQARHRHQQRRHPARPHAHQHGRGGVGRGDPGAPEGHVRALASRRRLLARREQEDRRPVKGRIINTSSTSGIYGNVGQTNYGAAKAGIAAFTIIAARELRRYGVTVNAISPSAQTRMTEGLRQLTEEQRAQRDPKWVSPTVVYLASEEAQDITGRVIQAGFGRIAVCEGWRRGAEVGQVEDPAIAGRWCAR